MRERSGLSFGNARNNSVMPAAIHPLPLPQKKEHQVHDKKDHSVFAMNLSRKPFLLRHDQYIFYPS